MRSIAELVTVPGDMNLDFADVESIMRDAGQAWMSIGWGSGENRAKEAAQQAISNPLLDTSIEGASGVLLNITGGSDLKLSELHQAAEVIQRVVHPDCNIIFGMVQDLKLDDEVKITIIATGFPGADALIPNEESLFSQMELASVSANGGEDLDLPPFLRRLPALRRRGKI